MRIFERWYFGLCWNLRLVIGVMIISWRILVSCTEFFWRLHFCMVKYLNFHHSSFAIRYFLKTNCKWQDHNVTHPLFSFYFSKLNGRANRKEHTENNNDNYKTPSMQSQSVVVELKYFHKGFNRWNLTFLGGTGLYLACSIVLKNPCNISKHGICSKLTTRRIYHTLPLAWDGQM
jgi:hypothetical protein